MAKTKNLKITSKIKLSAAEKKLVLSILRKVSKEKKKKGFDLQLLEFDYLYEKLITQKERSLIKKIIDTNPLAYGIKLPFLGTPVNPKNLIEIENQKIKIGKKVKVLEKQYLPKAVYNAYLMLSNSVFQDTGKKLLVDSGYRAAGCQTICFLEALKGNRFNFAKTMSEFALPGYSEHGFFEKQAIDFITEKRATAKGIKFEKTAEYKWLLKYAGKFGFHLSYPKGNPYGVTFEPRHWYYKSTWEPIN